MNQKQSRTGRMVESTPVRPTREMVRRRTLELAAIAGRGPRYIKQVDYEQAKRELTGEWDFDRQQEILDGWG